MKTDQKLYLSLAGLALATGLLLLIPLIAMQYTGEVNWTPADFIIAGGLIFSTGLAYLLIARKSARIIYRLAVGSLLLSSLFLVWANGAVGIVGSEHNAFNLLYFIVIVVGITGAFAARFKPKGMMIASFAMAATQALVALSAFLTGMAEAPESTVLEIIGVNAFFVTLFIVSAGLFHFAAKRETGPVWTTRQADNE